MATGNYSPDTPGDRTPFAETEVLLEVLEGRTGDAKDRLRAFTPTERRAFRAALQDTAILVDVVDREDPA